MSIILSAQSVEGVIRLLQQYKILSGVLPINFIKCSAGEKSVFDKIVSICSESVVPFN